MLSPNIVNTRFRGWDFANSTLIVPETEPVIVGAAMKYQMPNSSIVTLLDEQRLTGYLTLPSGYSLLEFGNTLPPTLNSTIAQSLGRTLPRDPKFDSNWRNLLRSLNYSPSSQYVRFTLSNTQNIVPMAQVLYDGENDVFMVGNSPSDASYSYLSMPKATAEEIRISNLQLVPRGNPPTSGTNTLNWINRVTNTTGTFFNGQAISLAPKLSGNVVGSRRQLPSGIKLSNSVVLSTGKQGAALAAAVGGGASGLASVLQQQAMQENWFQYMTQSQQMQIQANIDQLAQQFENNKQLQALAQQFQMQYAEAQHKQELETMEFQSRQNAGYTSLAQHQRNNLKQDIDFQPEAGISNDKTTDQTENERQGIGMTNATPQTSETLAQTTSTADPTYDKRLREFKSKRDAYTTSLESNPKIPTLQQEYTDNFQKNNPVNIDASSAKLYQGGAKTNFQSAPDIKQAKLAQNPIYAKDETGIATSKDAATSAAKKKSNAAGVDQLKDYDARKKFIQGRTFYNSNNSKFLQPTVI